MGIEYAEEDAWYIEVKNGVLYGDTSMDNFDMERFMTEIGVTGVIWTQDNHGSEWDEAEVEPCDKLCDGCQLRFACYTNKWNGKGDINEEV